MYFSVKNKFLISILYLFLASISNIFATENDDSTDAKRSHSPSIPEDTESDKKSKEDKKENEKENLKASSFFSSSPGQTEEFKFKIGFEFQLSHHIFPKALSDIRLQKKPIFNVYNTFEKDLKIWHVEFDGKDIEFVTVPFTNTEINLLERTLIQIRYSITLLQELSEENTEEKTFSHWVNKLKKEKFDLETTIIYSEVSEKKMMFPPDEKWVPIFQPQVTIQHPLNFTIPLSFALFGFDNQTMIRYFIASLPYYSAIYERISNYNGFKNDQNKDLIYQLLTTKPAGLAFLHAFTMIRMTPIKDNSDSDFLQQIFKKSEGQIDVKRYLALMTRRPFSSMLQDINDDPILEKAGSYIAYFKENIEAGNIDFKDAFNVPGLLYKSNYGEIFFDNNGKIRDLSEKTSLFEEEFLKSNSDVLLSLLKKGIICTVMTRNLKNKDKIYNLPEEYYNCALESIANPKPRYSIDLDSKNELVKIDGSWKHDVLSPPWFLHVEDSIGRYKDDDQSCKTYGEAIIEFRGIRKVGDWFKTKNDLNKVKYGFFLTNPNDIVNHGMTLFKFIKKLNSNDVINDIKLGIFFTLLRFRQWN